MSRSYKKTPGPCDRGPWWKTYANHVLRHKKDVPNGKAYRKFTCSYNICDYKCTWFNELKEFNMYKNSQHLNLTDEEIVLILKKDRRK